MEIGRSRIWHKGTPGGEVRTTWNTNDIWIRRDFTLGNLPGINKDSVVLYIDHDDNCEVYINGVKAADINGYTSGYSMVPINEAGKKALLFNGKNVMAIHCHQDRGGQYIDAGISVISFDKPLSISPAKQ